MDTPPQDTSIVDLSVSPPTGTEPVPTNSDTLPEHAAPRERLYAALGAVSLTLLVVMVSITPWNAKQHIPENLAAAPVLIPPAPTPPPADNPFESVTLTARAAIVYDVRTGQTLFAKNENEVLSLASLTKLMTVRAAEEVLRPDSIVPITATAIDTEGDSGFTIDEQWTFENLASFTLLTSSNDGAEAIAATAGTALERSTYASEPVSEYTAVTAFIRHMNEFAKKVSMDSTTFTNPTGLDSEPGSTGAHGTAHDVAKLLAHLAEHPREPFVATAAKEQVILSADGREHTAMNTNPFVESVTGLMVSKTGYTEAGANLAILFNAGLNQPVAIVVLGSTREDRFTDTDRLITALYQFVESGWYDYTTAQNER